MPDEEPSGLIERAREGDAQAIESLLLRSKERIERTARALLGEGLRARVRTSDLLQSTFVEVLGSMHEFRGQTQDAFEHWVARILQNNVRDAVKFHAARRRSPEREVRDPDLELVGPAPGGASPSSEAVLNDEMRRVGRALRTLSPDYRRVILLRMRPGATHEEIARLLGRTPGATRVLLARARAALLVALDGNAEGLDVVRD